MTGLEHFLSLFMSLIILNVMTVLGINDWIAVELDCPTKNVRWMPSTHVLPGELQRDIKTLPDGLVIRESSIPGGGLGVFSETFIPRYTWFGGFEGEVVVLKEDISDYSWTIYRGGTVHHYLDGRDNTTSNWMRLVNCSRGKSEENVDMRQCCDVPHYVANKDIIPGQEILMYYGDNYAKKLGIDVDNYITN